MALIQDWHWAAATLAVGLVGCLPGIGEDLVDDLSTAHMVITAPYSPEREGFEVSPGSTIKLQATGHVAAVLRASAAHWMQHVDTRIEVVEQGGIPVEFAPRTSPELSPTGTEKWLGSVRIAMDEFPHRWHVNGFHIAEDLLEHGAERHFAVTALHELGHILFPGEHLERPGGLMSTAAPVEALGNIDQESIDLICGVQPCKN